MKWVKELNIYCDDISFYDMRLKLEYIANKVKAKYQYWGSNTMLVYKGKNKTLVNFLNYDEKINYDKAKFINSNSFRFPRIAFYRIFKEK